MHRLHKFFYIDRRVAGASSVQVWSTLLMYVLGQGEGAFTSTTPLNKLATSFHHFPFSKWLSSMRHSLSHSCFSSLHSSTVFMVTALLKDNSMPHPSCESATQSFQLVFMPILSTLYLGKLLGILCPSPPSVVNSRSLLYSTLRHSYYLDSFRTSRELNWPCTLWTCPAFFYSFIPSLIARAAFRGLILHESVFVMSGQVVLLAGKISPEPPVNTHVLQRGSRHIRISTEIHVLSLHLTYVVNSIFMHHFACKLHTGFCFLWVLSFIMNWRHHDTQAILSHHTTPLTLVKRFKIKKNNIFTFCLEFTAGQLSCQRGSKKRKRERKQER